MKDDRIDFYQEVLVTIDAMVPKYRGMKGVVLGVSEESGIIYGYSVLLNGMDHSVYFARDDLTPTGTRFSREDFY